MLKIHNSRAGSVDIPQETLDESRSPRLLCPCSAEQLSMGKQVAKLLTM